MPCFKTRRSFCFLCVLCMFLYGIMPEIDLFAIHEFLAVTAWLFLLVPVDFYTEFYEDTFQNRCFSKFNALMCFLIFAWLFCLEMRHVHAALSWITLKNYSLQWTHFHHSVSDYFRNAKPANLHVISALFALFYDNQNTHRLLLAMKNMLRLRRL